MPNKLANDGSLLYSNVHGDLFGPGVYLGVYEQALLMHVAYNLGVMFTQRRRLEWHAKMRKMHVFKKNFLADARSWGERPPDPPARAERAARASLRARSALF
jgi:hypothetical protein